MKNPLWQTPFSLDVDTQTRRAFNALTQLSDGQLKRGVVTASGGNDGFAVAHAAHVLAIPATVCLPESATEAKLAAIHLLGPIHLQ